MRSGRPLSAASRSRARPMALWLILPQRRDAVGAAGREAGPTGDRLRLHQPSRPGRPHRVAANGVGHFPALTVVRIHGGRAKHPDDVNLAPGWAAPSNVLSVLQVFEEIIP